MIVDELVSGVAAYLEAGEPGEGDVLVTRAGDPVILRDGSPVVVGGGQGVMVEAEIFERDEGKDSQYPAIIVGELGAPEEHEILRGVWTVPLGVRVKTAPEPDEGAGGHRALTEDVACLIGNVPNLQASLLGDGVRCWDVWGGSAGETETEDGFRMTTFTLEATVSEAN